MQYLQHLFGFCGKVSALVGKVCSAQNLIDAHAARVRTRPRCPSDCVLDFFETPSCVFVQQARDQGLIGQPLSERPLLDRLQVLAREPDV
jgi:hypothetical protein